MMIRPGKALLLLLANALPILLTSLLLQWPSETLGAEQTLVIDFEKGQHSLEQPPSGDYPPDGVGNSLTIERGGTRLRQSRGNGLPSSVKELRELVLQFDQIFSRRFEQLSKRLDRLEANQMHFRHAALADWAAFSVDKRIRLFGQTKASWQEADQMCKAHAGSLLKIDSEHENQRILEFLKSSEGIYWIGMQTTLQFNISAVGNYSNFGTELNQNGENLLEELVRRCAAISAHTQGRWMNRECSEKHSFICQI